MIIWLKLLGGRSLFFIMRMSVRLIAGALSLGTSWRIDEVFFFFVDPSLEGTFFVFPESVPPRVFFGGDRTRFTILLHVFSHGTANFFISLFHCLNLWFRQRIRRIGIEKRPVPPLGRLAEIPHPSPRLPRFPTLSHSCHFDHSWYLTPSASKSAFAFSTP